MWLDLDHVYKDLLLSLLMFCYAKEPNISLVVPLLFPDMLMEM